MRLIKALQTPTFTKALANFQAMEPSGLAFMMSLAIAGMTPTTEDLPEVPVETNRLHSTLALAFAYGLQRQKANRPKGVTA
jgi:hypothetical protein